MHAAARHREVEVLRIARIMDDRMQLRAVGRAVLRRAHPSAVLRIVVDGGSRRPGDAAVFRSEQALRRGAGVPDVGLAGRAGRQPERVIDGARFHTADGRAESRRFGRLFPRAAEVGRAENRRPEVAGLGGGKQRAAVARIEHEVADDVAEKMRAVGAPGAAGSVAVVDPRTLARGDEQQHAFSGSHYALLFRRADQRACCVASAAATVSRIGRIGRTSTQPTRAGGIFAAMLIASLRSRASIM